MKWTEKEYNTIVKYAKSEDGCWGVDCDMCPLFSLYSEKPENPLALEQALSRRCRIANISYDGDNHDIKIKKKCLKILLEMI